MVSSYWPSVSTELLPSSLIPLPPRNRIMEHPNEKNLSQGNLSFLVNPDQEKPMAKDCTCGQGGDLSTTEALEGMCAIAPAPELRDRLKAELANLRESSLSGLAQSLSIARDPRRLGFNDGVIIPPSEFEIGTAFSAIRGAAAGSRAGHRRTGGLLGPGDGATKKSFP